LISRQTDTKKSLVFNEIFAFTKAKKHIDFVITNILSTFAR